MNHDGSSVQSNDRIVWAWQDTVLTVGKSPEVLSQGLSCFGFEWRRSSPGRETRSPVIGLSSLRLLRVARQRKAKKGVGLERLGEEEALQPVDPKGNEQRLG